MSYEPLHHKYRPQKFKDLVGQETIALTLSNAIAQAKIAPAYLFTGPRGTGKTSSARILAKSLNCQRSDKPTSNPCGECEVCLAIARGTALDVTEIDAASNTGVDNIREIIERCRFAPVQCRYKVYAIDECLTGDSLIQTKQGLMRIDNPDLKGRQVLSYNENLKTWEYKKVLRWLERGTKQTLTIKTGDREIRCTANHLIRTEAGWIEAKNVREGMKILSPVNADVEPPFIDMAQMGDNADLQQDISLGEISTAARLTISAKFCNKQKQYDPYVNFTELCSEMGASNIRTHIVDSLVYAGHMESNSKKGWNTERNGYNHCVHDYEMSLIEDMAKNQSSAIQLVILNYKAFMKLSSQISIVNQFQGNGFNLLHQKDLLGGIWMTVLSNLVQKVIPQSFYTLKDFPNKRIKLLLNGLQIWDILPIQSHTSEVLRRRNIITSNWKQTPLENGCRTYNRIQSPQWITNLERVESVSNADREKVYDLEVEENHNFVANGLLVHNCHMLSTAAFNALLKTLEEPPPNVVFILATTDPQRVLSTIISRCQRFDYRRIPLAEMVTHLKYIAEREQIAIADEALTLVAQIANGGLRDAESLLDQLSLLPEKITVAKVWDLVGAVPELDLLNLLQAIRTGHAAEIIQQCRSLLDRGREPLVVLQNLASFYLNLLIAKTAPDRSEMVAVTETCWQQLRTEAENWEIGQILQGQQHLKAAETQLKQTTQPRLWLEITLLGLIAAEGVSSMPTVAKTVNTAKVAAPKPTKIAEVKPDREEISVAQQPETKSPPAEVNQVPEPQTAASSEPERNIVQFKPTQTTATPIEETKNNLDASATNKPMETTVDSADEAASSADNEAIWEKVIQCLQPPTTQALLRQQCHLISLSGSRAIVGIGSAKLQRLHQGKVTNIETAFAKVCQRIVKVKLEVATPQKSATKDTAAAPTVTTPAPQSETTAEARSTAYSDRWSKTDFQSETKSNRDRETELSNYDRAAISDRAIEPDTYNDVAALPTPKKNLTKPIASPPPVTKEVASPSTDVEIQPIAPPETATPDFDSIDDAEDKNDLQRAIADLTQSFEGELVQLDNYALETSDSLDLEDTESQTEFSSNDDNLNPDNGQDTFAASSSDRFVDTREQILANYDEDDEDVPF